MSNQTARYWRQLENGHIQCDLCPRHCQLKEGQRGFCFVRAREGNQLVLTTYGRSTGFCVDPIEKKPLNHFLPGTPVLSFGTAGCNLGCRFCQNWESSKSRQVASGSQKATAEEVAKTAEKENCRSVAFTYNEPIIWAEYAIDSAIACHERGIKTVAVTAGYINEGAREEFFAHIDAANVDLKSISPEFYRKLCFAELEPVLDTLIWLKMESNVWVEVTTLVIPGENDSDAELNKLSQWMFENLGADVPIHFSAFHPDFKMRDRARTPASTLAKAREIAKQNGLRYVYSGNVHDLAGDATVCPECGETLIQRDWYKLLSWNLDGNKCSNCGCVIEGVFEKEPGNWGSKRAPLWFS